MRPESCGDAKRGLRFYRRQERRWRTKMGAAQPAKYRPSRESRMTACPRVRHLAAVARTRARHAHRVYLRWWREYAWQDWLPAKFYRVARCETGVDWTFDSGTYVSAFGIIRVAFPGWNGHNTPREQYEVADSIRARYGWSAWGCGGA